MYQIGTFFRQLKNKKQQQSVHHIIKTIIEYLKGEL